jgi:hypothetical protein
MKVDMLRFAMKDGEVKACTLLEAVLVPGGLSERRETLDIDQEEESQAVLQITSRQTGVSLSTTCLWRCSMGGRENLNILLAMNLFKSISHGAKL